MSGGNPLVGLIGNYESGSESEAEVDASAVLASRSGSITISSCAPVVTSQAIASVTHPSAPVLHCPWSACYDEGSGYTYYWHQVTNEVTWEAPPEYLLALKVASHQLNSTVQNEVTAEEWQLYQQALQEKQKTLMRPGIPKPSAPTTVRGKTDDKNISAKKRRPSADSDDEKIELITSYYHSDSDSNDEPESPAKLESVPTKPPIKVTKKLPKKPKAKPLMEYGPTLPPNQEYSIPIGPELPADFIVETPKEEKVNPETVPASELKTDDGIGITEVSSAPSLEGASESQDEEKLMEELMNKAKILQNLGGELPSDLKKLMKPNKSGENSPDTAPRTNDTSRESHTTMDTNIDDLLEEIEKKEMPKRLKPKNVEKIDMFSDDANFPSNVSEDNAPKESEFQKMNKIDAKPLVAPLFPSSTGISSEPTPIVETVAPTTTCLFPSATSTEIVLQSSVPTTTAETKVAETLNKVSQEKKGANIYIMSSEGLEAVPKKRKRISSSVLPAQKVSEVPSYTTKYSQYIDGFSGERTGLGFSKVDEEFDEQPKKAVGYGSYLKFTKGETLNEEKVEEASGDKENIDSISELLESKLRFLNQQSVLISPVQEMTIQMQTLSAAYCVGALTVAYWRGWLTAAGDSLARLEASAAPPGWICEFDREEGQYRYRRTWDGHTQWEYPAPSAEPGQEDMDICTTPPPPPPPCQDAAPPPCLDAAPPPPASLPPPPPPSTPAPPPKKKRITPAPPPPPPPPSLLVQHPPPPPVQEPPPEPPVPPKWRSRPPPPPPPPAWSSAPPPPPPPPPVWNDPASPPPPPPGCEDDVPKPLVSIQESSIAPVAEQRSRQASPPRRESLGDELMSFYSDIAELEKSIVPSPPPPESEPPAAASEPVVALEVPPPPPRETHKHVKVNSQPEANGTPKPTKKKAKVKISAGMGMKQKTVSSLVAKWQQVQDEINSD